MVRLGRKVLLVRDLTDTMYNSDVAVLFVRRLALPKEQIALFRRYLESGKPLVALRTASHAFAVGGNPPDGCDQWRSSGSLYYPSPLKPDATVLMTGSLGDKTEPVTWIRKYKGGRVFYTSLGRLQSQISRTTRSRNDPRCPLRLRPSRAPGMPR